MILVVFIATGIATCSGGSSSSSSGDSDQAASSSNSSSTEVPSRAELRSRREVAQRYWSGTIGFLAFAGAAIGFAGDSIGNGDSISAQQYLTQAEKFADEAYNAASNDEPPGDTWSSIQTDLMNTASSYKKAIGEMKDGLGQDDSEKVAAAVDDATEAGQSVTEATHDARVWYEQNGGKWSDIEDFPTAEQSISSSLKSLVNGQ